MAAPDFFVLVLENLVRVDLRQNLLTHDNGSNRQAQSSGDTLPIEHEHEDEHDLVAATPLCASSGYEPQGSTPAQFASLHRRRFVEPFFDAFLDPHVSPEEESPAERPLNIDDATPLDTGKETEATKISTKSNHFVRSSSSLWLSKSAETAPAPYFS
jgi:hypothetical protein